MTTGYESMLEIEQDAEMRHAAVVRRRLAIFQNVPDTPNGVDQRSHAVIIDLTAQPIDVNIHNVCGRIDSRAPHMVKDHAPRYYPTGIATEIFQNRELLSRQLKQLIASSGFMTH